MRIRSRFLMAAALVASFFSTVVQADQLDDIKKKGEIVIGVLGIDEPNSFVDPKTREFIGYEIDLAKAVAEKIGVKPVFKQVAVAARIPELQQGHVDLLAASLTHNKERESQVDFGLTHLVTGSKVLVKKISGISQVSELAGKKALTVKGGTQGPNLLRVVPTAEIVTFETTQQAFQALQQGKGVAYVNDEVSLLSDFAKLGAANKDYLILPENLNVEPLAFGIKKGEPRLKAVVDDTLRELEASDQAEKLFLKWYGPDSRIKFPKREFKIESDQVAG
jgi:polar amino acid transport system substrate-binding protein